VKKEMQRAEEEHQFMMNHLEKVNGELRMQNIRLESENRAGRDKCAMLEGIIKETRANSTNPSLSEMTAYRLLQEENKELKNLIKNMIVKNDPM
jgi:hypothetical protein